MIPRRFRRPPPWLTALFVLAALLTRRLTTAPGPAPGPEARRTQGPLRVTRVIDGDTLELENGTRVRLLGVDAPEMGGSTGTPEPGALAARDWLHRRLHGQPVYLENGPQPVDVRGRRLAWVTDTDGQLVNEALLEAGHARLVTSWDLPPALSSRLHRAAARARVAGRGIWKRRSRSPH